MGRVRTSPKKNLLGKRPGGGVLTAAEKRKRMLEAGRRFVMKSVHRLSPARISGKGNTHNVHMSHLELKSGNPGATTLNSSKSRCRNGLATPVRVPIPAVSSTVKEKSGYQSCDEELFKKDENSISEILNHRPISRSTGRPSHLRQNRPSFFPNGINPIDKALSTKELVPPKKPPRSFKEAGLQSFVVSKTEHNSVEEGNPEKVPASSSRKTPGKSVRFAENVVCQSPASSYIEHSRLVKEWSQLFDNVNNAQMEEILEAIPRKTFQRLFYAVIRVEAGVRTKGTKRSLFISNLKCEAIREDEVLNEVETGSSSEVLRKNVLSPHVYNTRLNPIPDIKVSEEASQTKSLEGVQRAEVTRADNPLFSTFLNRDSNALLQIIYAEDTPPSSRRVPYNLRSSPVVALGSLLKPEQLR